MKPGGVYFMEDLHVGRHHDFQKDNWGLPVISDIIQAWIEQLLISCPGWGDPTHNSKRHPLPMDVEAIFCQHEACAITKQSRDYPLKEWEPSMSKSAEGRPRIEFGVIEDLFHIVRQMDQVSD